MERRLGKGLGSLLAEGRAGGSRQEIALDAMEPNPHQPRRTFDPTALDELRDSIRRHGVLQPVVVREREGRFELISGERRWRAARLAGLATIPATIRNDVDDDQMLELAMVENLQRRDLNPLERAQGFRDMMQSLAVTQEDVAGKVGLNRSTVANHLRLLELPEPVQKLVALGQLSMGHARALVALEQPAAQRRLAELAVRQDFSVREVERRVREAKAPRKRVPRSEGADRREGEIEPWAREIMAKLEQRLGTRVRLMNGPGFRGQILVDYYSRDDLERIYALLAPPEEV